MDLTAADYVLPAFVANFKKSWDELGDEHETLETYSLTAVPGVKGTTSPILQNIYK